MSPSKTSIAWGFLSCGFLGAAMLFLTQDPNTALGASMGGGALWSPVLALAAWEPRDGGE